MDLLCFCSVLCLLCLCARLFLCALWSPAEKGLTSWLSFVVSTVSWSLSIGILGQVWYLIVSIPDLCTLTYFAQGPQRSDAGEAQTGGLSVFEPLRSLYDIHVWYLQYWALYDDLAILFLSLFTGSIQVQSFGSFESLLGSIYTGNM